MAENSSKDLLKLEADATSSSSPSCLESKLFVCKKDSPFSASDAPPQKKPTMLPLPKSQLLGKVKDFLGVMSESNKKLLQDEKDNPGKHDIEALSGKESEVIEMNLTLGIADLHTPEAVAAAESAMAGRPPAIPLSENSSDDDDDDDKKEDKIEKQDDKVESKDAVRDTTTRNASKKKKLNNRFKIVELS